MVVVLITAAAFCGSVSAATYNAYDGNISTTQLTYFKDLLPNLNLKDNYVVCRTEQNQYVMVVGDLEYSNGVFTLDGSGGVYTINSNSNYNSYYTYDYTTIDNLTLNASDKIVYSDIGNYPQLEERGSHYEILQTILIVTVCLCVVIRGIFFASQRGRK